MSRRAFVITVSILLLSGAAIALAASRDVPVVVRTNLEGLPMQIGDFRAVEDSFSRAVYEELDADKHVYRHYYGPDGRRIDLYIGYYGTAKGGRTGHNPYACLPGAGWGILESGQVTLQNERYPEGVEVEFILSKKGASYEVVFHWYQSAGDKVLESGIEQNIQRFVGCVFYNRNDGAFVRVSLPATSDTIQEKKELGKWFSRKVLAYLPDYWPVEKEL